MNPEYSLEECTKEELNNLKALYLLKNCTSSLNVVFFFFLPVKEEARTSAKCEGLKEIDV